MLLDCTKSNHARASCVFRLFCSSSVSPNMCLCRCHGRALQQPRLKLPPRSHHFQRQWVSLSGPETLTLTLTVTLTLTRRCNLPRRFQRRFQLLLPLQRRSQQPLRPQPRHHNGQMQPYGTRKATLVHAYGCCRSGSGLRVRLTGVWASRKKTPYGCFKFLTGPSYGSFKHPYGTFKHPYKSFQTPVRHTPVRRTPVRQHETPVRQNETPVKRTRKTSYYSRKKDP